jgi:hypothetical protein
MIFFNFDLGSVSKFAEFSAIFVYNSGNAINPGGFSKVDCRAHTHGAVGPLVVEFIHVGLISFNWNVKIYCFAFVL